MEKQYEDFCDRIVDVSETLNTYGYTTLRGAMIDVGGNKLLAKEKYIALETRELEAVLAEGGAIDISISRASGSEIRAIGTVGRFIESLGEGLSLLELKLIADGAGAESTEDESMLLDSVLLQNAGCSHMYFDMTVPVGSESGVRALEELASLGFESVLVAVDGGRVFAAKDDSLVEGAVVVALLVENPYSTPHLVNETALIEGVVELICN